MRDAIKKVILASLGTAVVSTSKIKETLQSLVHQGKLTAEEAERLTHELCKAGEEEMHDLQGRISNTLDRAIQGMNLARAEDVSALRERLDNVEKRLSLLEDHLPQASLSPVFAPEKNSAGK